MTENNKRTINQEQSIQDTQENTESQHIQRTLWDNCLDYLKKVLTEPNYQLMINTVHFKSLHDSILSLELDNINSQKWVKDTCEPHILDFLNQQNQENVLIYYVQKQKPKDDQQLNLFNAIPKETQPKINSSIDEKFSFSKFIVGNNNRFAHAAAQAVARKPAEAYNPLFIYGSVGLGKTHLLHAIGNQIINEQPHLKAELITSEHFTNELINALKNKQTKHFKERFRNSDILLIDDIQFLAGKEATQEEFFHTFNTLHASKKQIVLTSDRPPKDIPTLQDRLSTRFAWGLIADIQPPELETRLAILRDKLETFDLLVSDEILHYIATQIPNNIRELEGALNKITAYASLLQTEITLSIASNIIKDMVGNSSERPLTVSKIQQTAANYFNIEIQDLTGKKRTKELAFQRQVCMYLSRELTDLSLPKIGQHFGNRDHSTVMHACDKIKASIEEDLEIKNIVSQLILQLKS